MITAKVKLDLKKKSLYLDLMVEILCKIKEERYTLKRNQLILRNLMFEMIIFIYMYINDVYTYICI